MTNLILAIGGISPETHPPKAPVPAGPPAQAGRLRSKSRKNQAKSPPQLIETENFRAYLDPPLFNYIEYVSRFYPS